jgi:hypothetical protein
MFPVIFPLSCLFEEVPPFYTGFNEMNSATKLAYDVSKSQERI